MNRKLLLINFVSIVSVIFFLTVGYSALNTELTISGEAMLRVDTEIRIVNIQLTSSTSGVYAVYRPKYTTDTVSMFTAANTTAGEAIYTVTVANKTGGKIEVKDIIEEAKNSSVNGFSYEIIGIEKDGVYQGETVTFTVKLTIPASTQTEDSRSNLSLKFDIQRWTPPDASVIVYDNAVTGINCNTVKCALDGLYSLLNS